MLVALGSLAAGEDPQSSNFTSFQTPPQGFDLVHILQECLIPIKRVSVLQRCVTLGILLRRLSLKTGEVSIASIAFLV